MNEGHVYVVPQIGSDEDNTSGAQELAWGHTVEMAALQGDEVGSDAFIELYNEYLAKYELCTDHIGFLQHTALCTLREMFNGRVAILVPKDTDEQTLIARIEDVATILVTNMMWTLASFPEDWMPNEEFKALPLEAKGVRFPFKMHGQSTEETDDCDD